MNLFFLRHAKAAARSRKWDPDGTRPLTREGEKRMFEVAKGMKSLDMSFDLIMTSPYIRAYRTAEILGEVFGAKKVFETKSLLPEANPKEVIAEINEKFPILKRIVLVSHEPFMSRLISLLLCGMDTTSINMRKSGVCKLSIGKLTLGQCATLEWMMTPRQMARLAKR